LDVGQSNWTPAQKTCREFLICFPTLGIFVDEEGHRSRGEDIAWLKFPQSINYRHPNLYIFHHSSVEIIRLDGSSYTTTRIGMDSKDIGKEVGNIPPSTYLPLPTPQYIGKGPRCGSIVVTSKDKHKTEIYEIDLEAATTSTGTKDAMETKQIVAKKSKSSSVSPASTSSSEETESQLDSSEA